MPVTGKYKSESSDRWIYLWGDETQAEEFERLLDEKFGTHRGARKTALTALNISRRLLNMYITSQRRVPDEIMAKLRKMPEWDYEVDPLS